MTKSTTNKARQETVKRPPAAAKPQKQASYAARGSKGILASAVKSR